jgi:hypothetical protein
MPSLLSSVGTIQEELAIRLNEVSADEAATYLGWINQTTQDIAFSFANTVPFLETSAEFTLSAGTRNYSLASNFDTMYSVIIPESDVKLTYVTKNEFDAIQPSASEQGIPSIYTIYQGAIEYYPVPGSSLTVRQYYNSTVPTVSAASATPPIPAAFNELYVLRGQQMGLERRGDYNQAQIVERRYEQMKQKFVQTLKTLGIKRIKDIREFRRSSSDPIVNAIWNG